MSFLWRFLKDRDTEILSEADPIVSRSDGQRSATSLRLVDSLPISPHVVARREEDSALKPAIERLLEIIGEAAGSVSEEFRVQHPNIAWSDVRRLRIVLAQHYHRVDTEQVWTIATSDIPRMVGDKISTTDRRSPRSVSVSGSPRRIRSVGTGAPPCLSSRPDGVRVIGQFRDRDQPGAEGQILVIERGLWRRGGGCMPRASSIRDNILEASMHALQEAGPRRPVRNGAPGNCCVGSEGGPSVPIRWPGPGCFRIHGLLRHLANDRRQQNENVHRLVSIAW